jgi:tRNA (guanine37-N1)-methyltransferase
VAWRRQQAVRRTAARRPDLAHASRALTVEGLERDAVVALARPADAAELLVLQRCCWVSEAQANDAVDIPPLVETLADVRASFETWTTFVVRAAGRLVGSVRGRLVEPDVWEIGRIMVAPDLEHRGLGRWLLALAERSAPPEATSYRLFTGAGSERNLRMYRRAGYRRFASPGADPTLGIVWLARPARNPDDFG